MSEAFLMNHGSGGNDAKIGDIVIKNEYDARIPYDGLLCNGQTIVRADYPLLDKRLRQRQLNETPPPAAMSNYKIFKKNTKFFALSDGNFLYGVTITGGSLIIVTDKNYTNNNYYIIQAIVEYNNCVYILCNDLKSIIQYEYKTQTTNYWMTLEDDKTYSNLFFDFNDDLSINVIISYYYSLDNVGYIIKKFNNELTESNPNDDINSSSSTSGIIQKIEKRNNKYYVATSKKGFFELDTIYQENTFLNLYNTEETEENWKTPKITTGTSYFEFLDGDLIYFDGSAYYSMITFQAIPILFHYSNNSVPSQGYNQIIFYNKNIKKYEIYITYIYTFSGQYSQPLYYTTTNDITTPIINTETNSPWVSFGAYSYTFSGLQIQHSKNSILMRLIGNNTDYYIFLLNNQEYTLPSLLNKNSFSQSQNVAYIKTGQDVSKENKEIWPEKYETSTTTET